MQVTIARQLGLDPSTVSNFFMNARRRSVDKWKDDRAEALLNETEDEEDLESSVSSPPPLALTPTSRGHHYTDQVSLKATQNAVLVTSANPAAVVQHLHQSAGAESMTPTAALDL